MLQQALSSKLLQLAEQFREDSVILTDFQEEAMKIGKIEGKLEDIEKMLNRGCDWDFITDITEISEEQFLEYKKQYNK